MIRLLLGMLSITVAGVAGEQRASTTAVAAKHQEAVVVRDHGQPHAPAAGLSGLAKDALAQVFPAPRIVTPRVEPGSTPRAIPMRRAPRVVCGMRLFATDPDLDRGIRHVPEQHSDVEFAARRIHPSTCADAGRR